MEVLDQDEHWMWHAMRLAERARQAGEVPVGALLIHGDTLLAEGWNSPSGLTTPAPTRKSWHCGSRQVVENYRLVNTLFM